MKKIEFLYRLKLTQSEFEEIPEDQRALLGLVTFAVTEINALAKAYIYFDHDLTGDDLVDSAITIQKNAILRCWSAKILDLSKLFTDQSSRNRTEDPVVSELFETARRDFQRLKEREGYKLVRILRNEATNHYFLDPARRNLDALSEHADLSLVLHRLQGNSFSPLGEELMFLARISDYGKKLQTKEEKLALIDEWIDWNLDASDWCRELYDKHVRTIIFGQFPNKALTKEDHWIRPNLSGTRDEVLTPVFFRKADD